MSNDQFPISLLPRLRVALITSSLRLGGAEKQFVYMARALFTTGIDLRIFYLGCDGYYATVLQELGMPLRQIYSPNRPLAILARLIKSLWAFRPDLVLAGQFGDLLYAGPAGRLCRALTLGGVRSDGFYELNRYGHRSRWMLGLSHGLIANSHHAKENLLSRGVNSPRIEVLPNIIDLEEFDAQAKLPIAHSWPSERVVVAVVGSLHACKRLDRFLEAFALAQRREALLFGVIAGTDQGARMALENRAKALGLLPEHLRFFGECHHVPALLAQAHALVLCSDYEGFPNVLLEAMAAGLPVITTPAGDARLIVQDELTGFVVEGEDTKRMADCMARLAQSAELRMRLGEAGRQRVEHEYQYDSLGGRLLCLFQEFARLQHRPSLLQRLRQTLLSNPSSPHVICRTSQS